MNNEPKEQVSDNEFRKIKQSIENMDSEQLRDIMNSVTQQVRRVEASARLQRNSSTKLQLPKSGGIWGDRKPSTEPLGTPKTGGIWGDRKLKARQQQYTQCH